MFFFFFPTSVAAYTSITTRTAKKEIRDMGFQQWFPNTAAYKKIVSELPNHPAFQNIIIESEGTRKDIDSSANIYCDIMSSQGRKRTRLNWLIEESSFTCIYVNSPHVLGDTVGEIIAVYERCLAKQKAIYVIDNTVATKESPYSTATIDGIPLDKEKQKEVIDSLVFLKDDLTATSVTARKGARGTAKNALTKDFWNAYFLYEITLEIPEDFATLIAGTSLRTFHTRCVEAEEAYDQKHFRISDKFYSYQDLLEKTLTLKGLTYEQFFNIPKRFGALPTSDICDFNTLRKAMENEENKTTDLHILQEKLDNYCVEYKFKKMHYLNFKRYCAKQDNPSKKTYGKYYNYDKSTINTLRIFKEKLENSYKSISEQSANPTLKQAFAETMQEDLEKSLRELLLAKYSFDIG